jgi:hypothetical protein
LGESVAIVKLAPTNAAALQIGGVTIDKYFNGWSERSARVDWFVVDEPSMMTMRHWSLLLKVKQAWPDAGWFIVGDFGQLPAVDPIPDHKGGTRMHPGTRKIDERHPILHTLCNGLCYTLTKFQRGDRELFDLCVCARAGEDVASAFPEHEETKWAIAYLHDTRIKWNEEAELKFVEGKQTVTVERNEKDDRSQTVRLCYGYPVIARVGAASLGLRKADRLTVIKVTKQHLELRREDEKLKKKDRPKITIDTDLFHNYFRPGFCVTLYQAQGATFREGYTILDWDARNKRTGELHMGPRERYVAISRGTCRANVQVRVEEGRVEEEQVEVQRVEEQPVSTAEDVVEEAVVEPTPGYSHNPNSVPWRFVPPADKVQRTSKPVTRPAWRQLKLGERP